MPADRFAQALNEQIANEFFASQQYLAVAIHYEAQTFPRLAAFFYAQAVEERNHALMMVKYLLDAGGAVSIPGVRGPRGGFDDVISPIALALEAERKVTDQITGLAALAREEADYTSEQFMQWFIKEQVEEEAVMLDLLQVAERARDDPMRIEEYLAREDLRGDGEDPTAPDIAGGGP